MLRLWSFFVLSFVLPSPLAASRNVTTIATEADHTIQEQTTTQVLSTIVFSLLLLLRLAFVNLVLARSSTSGGPSRYFVQC